MKMRVKTFVTVASLSLLAGCGRQSILEPGGPASGRIAHLGWFVLILSIIVTVVMWTLIALVVSRPRGSFDEHEPVDVGGGQGWVLIGGFAIPSIILAAMFVVGLNAMAKFPVHDGILMPAQIRLTGHQWWWQVQYMAGPVDRQVTTANEIHIPVGRPVDIDLTSVDVIHSFWVPAMHGKVDLIPGQMNRIRIEADHAGTYRGECGEYCGAQHAHMILLVIAETPDQYQRWLNHQRGEAETPVTGQQRHGEQLFSSGPCALCHTVRGTLANGRLGPDLTHIGSRQRIATNMLENNTANLEAWVTHAQSLKPAVAMPNITQFTGQELRDLVAYLQQLR